MSSNVKKLDETSNVPATGNQAPQADETAASHLFGGINNTVQRGVTALRGQLDTVREHGLTGVKDDITSYARNKPLTALAVAGGIGVLAALILKRR